MAHRKIIKIDEDLCDGCGNCITACEEGALQIIDGKAKLVKEIYCDGLGACMGDCPQDALTIEERDADEFDEAAVEQHLARLEQKDKVDKQPEQPVACGCPGAALRSLPQRDLPERELPGNAAGFAEQSALGHWPVQLMLVPVGAPFLLGADILISADCAPFTVPDFHSKYLQGRSVLVGCPKLDNLDHYRQKLKDMFASAQPKSLTVARMEVPCCGGIVQAVVEARDASCPNVPVEIHTLGIRNGSRVETVPPRARAAQGGS